MKNIINKRFIDALEYEVTGACIDPQVSWPRIIREHIPSLSRKRTTTKEYFLYLGTHY